MIPAQPNEHVFVVIDTDVVSYAFKRDTRAGLYDPHLKNRIAIIAAQTKAELELWALSHDWGARRRADLERHLRSFVLAPFDEGICLHWARATDSARRKGRSIQCADAWIAATALYFNVPLVTHNAEHYVSVPGLQIISESK